MTDRSRKNSLRTTLRTARAAAWERIGPEAAIALRDAFPQAIAQLPDRAQRYAGVVGGYFPIGSEIDPRPLMEKLAGRGWHCALPAVVEKDKPLLFRSWGARDSLMEGAFGTREPAPDLAHLVPDLILVPLLGFDGSGARIGYGRGFYDRTLAALRSSKQIVAVGLAFSEQETRRVPAESHDAGLDWIVTECGARHFGD